VTEDEKIMRMMEKKRVGRKQEAGLGQDLLFTPFLPLRSFLYCSLSWAISPWSTSQASSARGGCSSFSAGQQQEGGVETCCKCLDHTVYHNQLNSQNKGGEEGC